MRARFYTELKEPPFVDIDNGKAVGHSVMKMHRAPKGFIVSFNLLGWQSFRWYLWLLVTRLPLHEGISVETDDNEFHCMDYQAVPFSEITLVDGKDKAQCFLGCSYTYSGARADLRVTRKEAFEAYKRYCFMTSESGQPQAVCTKLFGDVWVQFTEYAGAKGNGSAEDVQGGVSGGAAPTRGRTKRAPEA